ncbi:filamentous hemagglutinin N-terminal domain-containing protein [Sphingomonas sp. 1P06PA]|uniref:two-partner secretion domain-containing protein n=1 Tax=Sphingomonas sp. 1P06PA TaxID=554121 RepID=UPI0039A57150
MTRFTPLATLRARLIVSTALMGGVVGVGAPAAAQTIPVDTLPQLNGIAAGTVTVTPPPAGGTTMQVAVGSARSIVDWTSFSVGRDATVAFSNSAGTAAILNRVSGGTSSVIEGAITSPGNLAVYLVNPNGITFGQSANVNVGALIASSLDLDAGQQAQFLAADPALRFQTVDGSTVLVRATDNARISTLNGAASGLGDLVFLGAGVGAEAGTQLSAGHDAAFIAGTDITMTASAASPLAFTITRGTQVRAAVTLDGSVAGRNVTLGFASQGAIDDAVLSVGGMITASAAVATDRGIQLVAGGVPTGTASSVTIAAADPGTPDIAITGTLRGRQAAGAATGTVSDVQIYGADLIDLGGGITSEAGSVRIGSTGDAVTIASGAILNASRDVIIDTAAAATVAGAVSAQRDYIVRGANVTLGGAVPMVQSAGGRVIATARNGALTGLAGLRLIANSDSTGVGAEPMLLSATGGAIDFGAASLTGGGNRSSKIGVFLGTAGSALTLGRIDARGLYSTNAAETLAFGNVLTTGDIRFAAPVSLRNALSVRSVAGDILIDGTLFVTGAGQSITLNAGDQLMANALISAQGNLSLRANGSLAIASAYSGGDISAVAGGSTDGTLLQAAGSITETSLGATAGIDTLVAGRASPIAPGDADPAASPSDPTPPASPTPTLFDVTIAGRTVDKVAVSAEGNLSVTATSGALTIGTATAGGTATLDKQGPTGELRVDRVTANGLVTIDSDSAARIGRAASLANAVIVTAVTAVTGLTPADPLNGADLIADSSGFGVDVAVSAANGVAALGTVVGDAFVDVDAATVRAQTIRSDEGTIDLNATGGTLTLGNARTSNGGNVVLTATGALAVTGAIASDGYYTADGASVTLGSADGTGSVQTARQYITITSRAGGITGRSGLRLTANSDDTPLAAEALTLSATGGEIDVGASQLAGGTTRTSRIGIYLGTAGSHVTLGSVAAAGLYGSNQTGTVFGDLETSGDIRFAGPVSLRNALVARTSNGGAITADSSIFVTGELQGIGLDADGALTANGVLSAQGLLDLAAGAGADLRFASAYANQGDARLGAGGSVVGTTLQAAGSVTINAGGSAAVSSLAAGRPGPYPFSPPVAGGDPAPAPSAPAGPADITVTAAAIDFASIAGRDIDLTATAGALFVGTANAERDATLTKQGATGDLAVTTLTAGNTITILSATDARIGTARSTGGTIGVTATRDTTGIAPADGANLIADGAAGRVDVTTGRTARIAQGVGDTGVTIIADGIAAGSLRSDAGTIDLTAGAGGVSLASARTGTATTTGGDLLIFASDANPANAAVSVTDGVIVDGDYIARGNSVALGAGAYQAADGLVAITAANGGITGGAGLRLISNADDGIAGGDSLLLSATGGDIDLAGTTLLGGLTNRTGRIGIYLGTAGSDVALGRVEARAINGTDITGTVYGDLETQGDIRFAGPVSLRNALVARTSAGAIRIDGTLSVTGFRQGVTLDASGDVVATKLVSAQGDLAIDAGGNVALTSAYANDGNASVSAGGATSGQLLQAAGFVAETAGSVAGIAQLIAGRAGPFVPSGPDLAADPGAPTPPPSAGPIGSDVTVTAASIDKSSINTPGALLLTTINGDLTLGTATVGGIATLDQNGIGRLAVTRLAAGDAIDIDADGAARIDFASSTAGSIDINAAGDVTAIDPTIGVTLFADGAGSDITVSAGDLLRIARARAADTLTLAATGTIDAADGQAGDAVLAQAPTIRFGRLASTVGTVTLNATVAVSGTTLTAATGVDVSSAGAQPIVAITTVQSSTGPVGISGATVTLGQASAFNGALTLTAIDGLSVTTARAGGTTGGAGVATLTTTGPNAEISVGTLNADVSARIAATGNARLGTVRSGAGGIDIDAGASVLGQPGDIGTTLLAAGPITIDAGLDAIILRGDADGAIDIAAGRSIDLSTARAGSDLLLTAGNDVRLGTGSAGGLARIEAVLGGVSIGSLNSNGAGTILTADAITIGSAISGAALLIDAGGRLEASTLRAATDLTATAAGIDIGTATATGGALALTAEAGDLDLDRGTAGTSAVLQTTGASGNITVAQQLGAGTGATIAAIGDARLARVSTIGGAITVTAGGEATGVTTADGMVLAAPTGPVTVTAGTLARFATIDAQGAIAVTADAIAGGRATSSAGSLSLIADAGGITLGTGGAATTALVDASGDVIVGTLIAGGDATVTAGGAAGIGLIRTTGAGGDIAVTARTATIDTAEVQNADGSGTLALTATGGDLRLRIGRSQGSATLQTTGGAGDVIVTGQLNSGAAATISSVGDARLQAVTAAGPISIVATGEATGGTLSGADIAISGGTLAQFDRITGADVTVGADVVDLGAVTASGSLRAEADGGDLTLDSGDAAGQATLIATGSATVGAIAGNGVDITAGGLASIGTLTARAGDAVVNAGSIEATNVTAGQALSLIATAGPITLGTGSAGTTALVDASGSATVGNLRAGGDVTVDAGGAAGIGDVGGSRVAVTSGGAATVGSLTARLGDGGVTAQSINLGVAETGQALTLRATGGGVTLGNGTAGTDATIDATGAAVVTGTLAATNIAITGASADVNVARADGQSLTIAATAGDARLGNGSATGGSASVTASGRATIGTLAGEQGATVAAGGAAVIDSIASSAGAVTVSGGSIAIGTATASQALTLRATAGDLTLGDGTADSAALSASGDADVSGSLSVTQDIALSAGGRADAGTLRATNAAVSVTGASVDLGTVAAATTIDATASSGALALTSGTAGGAVTLATTGGGTAGDISVGTLFAGGPVTVTSASDARLGRITSTTGAISVTAASGEVTGTGTGGRADLTAGGAATIIGGTLARLGTVTSGGTVRIEADAIETTAASANGGALTIVADGGSVTLGSGSARDAATIIASGDATVAGLLRAAGGAVTVTGNNASVGNGQASGAIVLTARTGSATLRQGSAGTTILVDAATKASLGADGLVSAGPATPATANIIEVRANDIDIGTGTDPAVRLRASGVSLRNRSAGALALGDAVAGDSGFASSPMQLTALELNRISAADLILDGSTRDVRIGTLALNGAAGSRTVSIYTTGRIDITGTVTDPGSTAGRLFTLGGTAAGNDFASAIRAAATPTAGGRLLFSDNSNIVLAANRIGFGQDLVFLDTIGLTPGTTPLSVAEIVDRFVSQPNSTLYVANAFRSNGVAYSAGAQLLTANRLTVRYSDFALFQNTAQPDVAGAASGVQINSLDSAQGPTIALGSSGEAAQNAFALFGEIADRTGTAAALLGGTLIQLNGVNPNNSRINGCLIGSGGGGCLISAVTPPVVNVFDPAQANVFASSADLAIEFDPVVGTNNEALFSDLGTIDFNTDDMVRCDPASDPTCRDTTTEQ